MTKETENRVKILAAVMSMGVSGCALLGILAGAWVQFIGPGIQSAAQDFLIKDLRDDLTEFAQDTNKRLEFIERHMPAPPVVEYDKRSSVQEGECTPSACTFRIRAARTAFGESCSRPTTTPYLRTYGGVEYEIRYRDFNPVHLTRRFTVFNVKLDIPSYIPPGHHEWRTLVTYPTCGEFTNVQRWTPWFGIVVTSE